MGEAQVACASLGTHIAGKQPRVSPCWSLMVGRGALSLCVAGRDRQEEKGRGSRSPRWPLVQQGHVLVTCQESQPPWVGAASGQWGTQPGHMGGGARWLAGETAGPHWGPGSQTGALCPLGLPEGGGMDCPSLYHPIPSGGPGGGVGGVLRWEGLGPAVERAGFSLAQLRFVLRRTACVLSQGSTVATPSARPASTTLARPARRRGLTVSHWQLRPEQAVGLARAEPELTGARVSRVP